jgi:hypothetical protein
MGRLSLTHCLNETLYAESPSFGTDNWRYSARRQFLGEDWKPAALWDDFVPVSA